MKNKQRMLRWAAPALLLPLLVGLVLAYLPNPVAASAQASGFRPPENTGGTITYGLSLFPPSTNPWFNNTTFGLEAQGALWARAVVPDPDGRYLPDQLAEVPTVQNGDVSPDGLTVVMKLRPDLTWSDGQPITADDFVYWLQTDQDPTTGANTLGYDHITSITAQDAHTVVLTYAQPYAPYLQYLPFAAPRHAWGSIPDDMLAGDQDVSLTPQVNSGPFTISSFVPGDNLTLVPNLHYTSSTFHQSVLDQLVFKAYPSQDALIAAYQAGDVQHTDGFNPNNISQFDGLPGLSLADDITFEWLGFNLVNPVLQDQHVRAAIAEAFDRCQLIEQSAQVPCKTLQTPGILPRPSPAFDPAANLPDFNLNQARKDMQAAGWDCSSSPCVKNNQPFPTLTLATTANNQRRAISSQLIQQGLAALGIPVTVQFYTSTALFSDFNSGGILATGQYDLSIFADSFNFDPDDLSAVAESSQIPNAQNPNAFNYGRISDSNLDTLFDQGRATVNQDERVKIYKQAQELIADQVYIVPLIRFPNITLTSAQVVNYADNISVVGNAWNIGDWWLKAEH